MRVCCAICSDLFEEISSIVSLPCGHTFHDFCLLQWLGQSKTCPSCRKHVTTKNMCRLFFEAVNGTEEVNPNKLQNDIQNLKADIHMKESEKQKLIQDNREITAYVKIAEDKAEENRQKYLESLNKITALKTQLKHMSKIDAEITWLREENSSLRKKLNLLKNVQILINGTQNEVEEILKSEGEGAPKHIITYCSLLKKELQCSIDVKKQLKNENEMLKKDIGYKSSALNIKESEISKLKNIVKQLEEENTSLEEKLNLVKSEQKKCDNSSLQSYIIIESPKPKRIKRNRTTTAIDCKNTLFDHENSQKKKLKINMVSSVINNKRTSTTNSASVTFSSNPFKSENNNIDNNIEKENIRVGYNGLGGHSQFIERSHLVTNKLKEKKMKEKQLGCKNETLDSFVRVKVV